MRSFFQQILSAFAVSICTASSIAVADLKKDVIENCPRALEQISLLTAEEQKAVIPYLQQLLQLRLGNFENRKGELITLDNRLSSVGVLGADPASLWLSFEPTRETDAKRCALQILIGMRENAVGALSSVIDLARQPTLPPDLRELLDQTFSAILVGLRAHPEVVYPDQELSLILAAVASPAQPYAEEALIEFQERAIPLLIDRFRRPDAAVRDNLQRLLLLIDPDGLLVVPTVLPLLLSSDDGLKKRVLELLKEYPGLSQQSIPPILSRLRDLSIEVQLKAAQALSSLMRSAKLPKTITLNDADQLYIVESFFTANSQLRDALLELASRCQLSDQIWQQFKAPADKHGKLALYQLLARMPHIPQPTYQSILPDISSDDREIRLAAIEVLGRHTEYQAIDVDILVRAFKFVTRLRDESLRREMSLALSAAVGRLKPGKAGVVLAPLVIDSAAYDSMSGEHPAIAALVGIGEEALPVATKALSRRDPAIRVAAVTAMARLGDGDQKTARYLLDRLGDPDSEVRLQTVKELTSYPSLSIDEIQRGFRSSSANQKFFSGLLLLSRAADNLEPSKFVSERLQAMRCDERIRLASRLEGTQLTLLFDSVFDCLEKQTTGILDEATVQLVLSAHNLPEATRRKLLVLVEQGRFEKRDGLRILNSGNQIGFLGTEVEPVLLGYLRDADRSVQLRAVELAASLIGGSSLVVEDLKRLFESNRSDPLFANSVAIVLARLNAPAFDYRKYFLEELESERVDWALASLERLERNLLGPVLVEGLQISDEKVQLKLASLLGAINWPEAVQPLTVATQSRNYDLRLTAASSLLKIAPESAATEKYIRMILACPQRELYLKGVFPQALRATFERVGSEIPSVSVGRAIAAIKYVS